MLKEKKPMNIAVMTFRLRAPWVHSLKEKRMIVKSLTARLQNKFHVSAAEIDEQDTHQIIVIGVAAIVPHNAMADGLMESISFLWRRIRTRRLSMKSGRYDSNVMVTNSEP